MGQFKVGDKVLVLDGRGCVNQRWDEGVVEEIDKDGDLRVQVEGRLDAGNWMGAFQVELSK